MKCKILHESAGRIRVHLNCRRMTLHQADVLEYYLRNVDGVREVSVFDRTQDAVIVYRADRAALVHALAAFSFDKAETMDLVPDHTTRKLNREFEDKLSWTVIRRVISKLFFPLPVITALAIYHSIKYIREGIEALLHGKLSVAVLDATAVTVSMVRGDFSTASSVMFMLRLGEILEDWTHKKSVADLAGAMSLNVDHVWLKTGETETLVPIGDIQAGDCVVVRTGSLIPLDGKVVSGEAMVNQASMTGESMPVPKREGSYVYAGTVAEEGECVVRVEKALGGGRYDRIVRMIEESEKLKSTAEDKASRLADRLVPYTLGGTILTYLITRNVTKMLAVLMVDFSCALKLSMPIAVLSAMRESSSHHISVKGGRFLEAVAQANTIVFDKTGTLTYATPKVARIVTFGGNEESEMLRLAACLEEHYPHSIANAVVAEARDRGLTHEEYHSQVQYVARAGNYAAHGFSYHGALRILKVILGYDYLWINVRVKGGAYGCMNGYMRNGDTYFVSYRDPNLSATNEIYDGIPAYLEKFDADEREMTGYIIGTISDMDTPMNPSAKGARSMTAYLQELDYETLSKERSQIIGAQPADIRALKPLIASVLSDGSLCVIGNEDVLTSEKQMFETLESLT